jgi:hypothetical protein
MGHATFGRHTSYWVTIGDHVYTATVSFRGIVLKADGPLRVWVGAPVGDLTADARRHGYPVSIHDVTPPAPPG